MYVCLNESKAKLLTVADFCSTAQVEFPIRESYTCVSKTCSIYAALGSPAKCTNCPYTEPRPCANPACARTRALINEIDLLSSTNIY